MLSFQPMGIPRLQWDHWTITVTAVALPKAQGIQDSSLCNPVARLGRRAGSPWGAYGTMGEEGEPQPRTSFTHGAGTVPGALCSLAVQAMAVTQVEP